MLTRRLTLKKETLAPLTADDLRAVAGAGDTATCITCLQCVIDTIGFASMDLTNCCDGIPTFHARGLAC